MKILFSLTEKLFLNFHHTVSIFYGIIYKIIRITLVKFLTTAVAAFD